jgi:glutamate-1-semialdehyde 2,1-aminomutase
MNLTWEVRDEDREFFAAELDDFVPDRVYDAHAHLWRKRDWEGNPPDIVRIAPPEITMEVYRKSMDWILPGREVHGLHFPFPATFPTDPSGPNEWVSQQLKNDPLARGQFYVRPSDDPEWVRQETRRLGLRGFKPFCGFAERPDKENAEIPEFFPEWCARLAHEEAWSVTLHVQRSRSLADQSNQHWILTYCSKYPVMKLILDHCARGFNAYHCMEGLSKLQGLDNLYADTSAICNPLAVMACVHYLGIDHVLYGSDFFCSHLRGTNLSVGDSFMWLGEDAPIWNSVLYQGNPLLIGLENLRAVKAAFHMLSLSENNIEDYFWNNAARLLGL